MAAIHVLSIIIIMCSTVLCQTNPITSLLNNNRATATRNTASRDILHDSTLLARVQSDILSSLGMSDPPNISAQETIPDYARQLALQQVVSNTDSTSEEDSGSHDEAHFMAENSNLLLVAQKVNKAGYGELIQFVVKDEDKGMKMSDIKLYYHINSENITMHPGSEDKKMNLRLSLLTENDGQTSSQIIQNVEIHRQLIGWHSQAIPTSLVRYVLNGEEEDSNATLSFQLTCLNCIYNAFPAVITKQNVPFLRVNGRRRLRRGRVNQCNPDGGCCMKELIVDFNAIGWDWVLYPKRYIANYCTGSCSSATSSNRRTMASNSHALNAMLSHLQASTSSSCCVPRTEEPLQIIFSDESGNVRTSHNSIKRVSSCRCT